VYVPTKPLAEQGTIPVGQATNIRKLNKSKRLPNGSLKIYSTLFLVELSISTSSSDKILIP